MTKIGNAFLYAGGWTRGAKAANCVTIDLTGSEYRWSTEVCAENAAAEVTFRRTLDSLMEETVIRSDSLAWISMPIRDYSIPKWTLNTWMNLSIDIFDSLKKGDSVLIACTGGHGRTGLAISIILSLLKVIPDGMNPVEYVRSHYCEGAVETLSQENYVYSILGLPYTAKASDYKGYFGKSYWYDDADDYYSSKSVKYSDDDKINGFGHCLLCNEYRWLVNEVCSKCEEDIIQTEKNATEVLDKAYAAKHVELGTCPYCGDTQVVLSEHNGDMICSKCQEWSKLRDQEIAKKSKGGICAYCGDNIETAYLYYNNDLICDECYVTLYGSGLVSEIVDTKDKSQRIVLTDKKIGTPKAETETK